MKKFVCAALCVVVVITASNLMAEQKKKPVTSPKGPVNSVDGILFPKGQIGFIYKMVTFNKDGLYDGASELTPKPDAPSEKEIWVHNFIVRYGLVENVEVKMRVPFKDLDLTRQDPVTKPEFSNSGLGDVTVWGRYQILSQKRKDPVFWWAGVGLNIPTGETDAKTNGKLDPMTMQVGDGSWDPVIDTGISKKIDKLKLSAFASYTFSTEGDNDYRWGDTFQFDLSAVYCLNNYIALDLELNNYWKDENENNDIDVNNTGGFQTYLTPGVHFMLPGTKHHLDFGVPITIYRDLNGPQPSEDYRIIVKAVLVF